MSQKFTPVIFLLVLGQSTPAIAAKLDTEPYKKVVIARCLQQIPEEKRSDKESKRKCHYDAWLTVSGHTELFDQYFKKAAKRECRKKSGSVRKCIFEAKRKYMDKTFRLEKK